VFHLPSALLIIYAMYLSSGKNSKNGTFGAKNHPSRRINFPFLIWLIWQELSGLYFCSAFNSSLVLLSNLIRAEYSGVT
jgi:hypothetical protein